jgi:hypothetical protein
MTIREHLMLAEEYRQKWRLHMEIVTSHLGGTFPDENPVPFQRMIRIAEILELADVEIPT